MIIQCRKGDYKKYRKETMPEPEKTNRHLTNKDREKLIEEFKNKEFNPEILEKGRIRKKG